LLPARKILRLATWLLLLLCIAVNADAQDDTLEHQSKRSLININDIFHQAMNSISRNPGDTIDESKLLLAKSEEAYYRYAGRYVRHIIIAQMGFEKKLSDTTSFLVTAGTKIYNHLHVNTRDWVIRDNMFIKEGEEVNPYEIADNERYLRTLDFIQDVRILLKPVKGHRDSVDLIVVSKDLFTITGSIDASGVQNVKATGADANFLGMGQRLQFSTLWAQGRDPAMGFEALYRKQSIARTFINATIAYSQINNGRIDGREQEDVYYLQLDRPLVSPYSHFAGGLIVSHNQSTNVYRKPDSVFYDYAYNIYDGWMGYNIGSKLLPHGQTPISARNRIFIAARYYNIHYEKSPLQVGDNFDPIYNSKKAILGSVTFFRQDFYKTQYVYGFGTTEDLPYGYSVTGTAGWTKQLDLERPYLGINLNRYIASGAGEFYQFFAQGGGFYHQGQSQDAVVLLGGSIFSRLVEFDRLKLRQYFRFSYTRMFNRVTSAPLRINNQYGLNDWGPDSVMGDRRINVYTEFVLFTNYKVLGFRMAPFVYGNAVFMTPEQQPIGKSDVYTGFGGGIRTNNQNLIFGTVELKLMYFPRTAYGQKEFRITLNSNIRFRYPSSYVTAPDVVQYNNNIYVF